MPSVSALEVSLELQRDDPALLIDVREHEEVESVRISSALHIPMRDIAERSFELEKDRRLVIVCHHGVRSAHVTAYLLSLGFSDVRNLTGGIDGWAKEVDPSMNRY